MPKNIFQDMVKIKQTKKPLNHKIYRESNIDTEIETRRQINKTDYPKRKSTLWLVAVVATIFFFFALSYFFSNAQIVVEPKIKNIDLNQNFSATLNADKDNLSFDMITISGDESTLVTASLEKKEVSQHAKGTIVIYNKFSSASQRLDINTRLEGSNGKIYKTEKAIVVPGMTGTTPGSVEVLAYGAEGGEAYNSKPLDFKILGFKGSPKYEKFYGRSKGNLSGGFVGPSFVVSPEEKTKALEDLKIKLQAKLFKKALGQIPAGFVLFQKASSLEVENMNNDLPMSNENPLSLSLKGTFYGLLFKEVDITKKITEKVVDGYNGEDVYISNINNLAFSLTNNTTTFKDLKSIDFNLAGPAKIVWRLNGEKLKLDLAGKKKSDFYQILDKYLNITSAKLSLRPVWSRTITDKIKDIKIIVNYPK